MAEAERRLTNQLNILGSVQPQVDLDSSFAANSNNGEASKKSLWSSHDDAVASRNATRRTTSSRSANNIFLLGKFLKNNV